MRRWVHKTKHCQEYQKDLGWELGEFDEYGPDIVSPKLFEIALSNGENATNEKFVLLGLVTCLECRFGR